MPTLPFVLCAHGHAMYPLTMLRLPSHCPLLTLNSDLVSSIFAALGPFTSTFSVLVRTYVLLCNPPRSYHTCRFLAIRSLRPFVLQLQHRATSAYKQRLVNPVAFRCLQSPALSSVCPWERESVKAQAVVSWVCLTARSSFYSGQCRASFHVLRLQRQIRPQVLRKYAFHSLRKISSCCWQLCWCSLRQPFRFFCFAVANLPSRVSTHLLS